MPGWNISKVDTTPIAGPVANRGDRRRAGAPQRLDATSITGLSQTKVTDAGLEHLKGLTQLQTLSLSQTKVTDSGLESLEGLNNSSAEPDANQGDRRRAGAPQRVDPTSLAGPDRRTQVTDAGLVHLKGLTQLQARWTCHIPR